MPSELTRLRVFIASPGGLAEERKAFREEIQEFNDADALHRGVLFQAAGCEDTLGDVGRPQTLINEDIRTADYFVLLLWNRWGSLPDASPSRFTSGTEEEYHLAMECHATQKTMRRIVILFKSVDPQQLSDSGPQLRRVLKFRKKIEQQKTHLFHSFDTTAHFRALIRKHLSAWLRDEENGQAPGTALSPAPIQPEVGKDVPDIPTPALDEPVKDSVISKAWKLAEEGRLTEAEVEFAGSIVRQDRPDNLIEYGRFLLRLGRLDQATVMLEGAISISDDHRDPAAAALAYGNLGIVLQTRGDLDGAEQMYRKSLEINERLGRLEGMVAAYGNLGNILQARGDLDAAAQTYRKALKAAEQLGSSKLATSLSSRLTSLRDPAG